MSDILPATAAIRAEPDGYDMAKTQLMGRQAAGNGFLRAAVGAARGRPLQAFAPFEHTAKAFKAIVRQIDPAASVNWIPSERLDLLGRAGTLYLADLTVAKHARLRQRAGVASFSLCGVTHTTASLGAMDEIVDLLREPVMPWDALVCTSSAVIETIRRMHEAEADYLRWRLGPEVRISGPQLPLIPLGVHCEDFDFDDAERAAARQALDLAEDEVVALFVGRLVFHAKAHPYAMYRGLQLAAERTGKRIALVLSGWFPNADIENAFRKGAADFAPDVRLIVLDGRRPELRDRAWAAADLFTSLSDNIQETFGLTPIEAMAAGLPVVVTDWDGYKDTVRDGVDGVRVRTLAPGPGSGGGLIRAAEVGSLNYDAYCWAAAAATAVDIGHTADAVAALASDPALRRRMGDAGRRRAREVYDWPVVYRQYETLWAELDARRAAALADPDLAARIAAAPRAAAARLDPFDAFGHYPTETIGPETRLVLAGPADPARLRQVIDHPLFSALSYPTELLLRLHARLGEGAATLEDLARDLTLNPATCTRAATLLVKAGLAEASRPDGR